MHRAFLHRVKHRIAALLLLGLLPACSYSRTLKLTVPAAEAATVGRLTQPVRRTAVERVILAGPGKPVRVGDITRVRVLGPKLKWTVPLPFWAEKREDLLVIEDRTGRPRAFPLAQVERLEVESTLDVNWQAAEAVLLIGFTVLAILSAGLGALAMESQD